MIMWGIYLEDASHGGHRIEIHLEKSWPTNNGHSEPYTKWLSKSGNRMVWKTSFLGDRDTSGILGKSPNIQG